MTHTVEMTDVELLMAIDALQCYKPINRDDKILKIRLICKLENATGNKVQLYEHQNGYIAKLYGKSAMTIYKDGEKILHTAKRGVNTKKEVMKLLGTSPEFFDFLERTSRKYDTTTNN
jgi:hypothetical protein